MRDTVSNDAADVSAPFVLHLGDCIEVMRSLPANSVDAVVTDPPYELGFMGKSWDASGIANNPEMWREALRVLKPGGHLLAFGGSRTYHRMVVAIEDAGFEIRDQIMWVYGSGFPKSQNISKAIDKQAGATREVISEGKAVKRMIPGADQNETGSWIKDNGREYVPQVTRAATPEAEQWEGWGTALKPAHEPIAVARKPLTKGATVAANVLLFGTGAINIDGCRVEPTGESGTRDGEQSQDRRYTDAGSTNVAAKPGIRGGDPAGRWPANLLHDGSPEVVGLFPEQESGSRAAGVRTGMGFHGADGDGGPAIVGSAGSAARFFYCAKTSRGDRNEGLSSADAPVVTKDATMRHCETADWSTRNGNHHPTVKPTDLMAYLVRLVTRPGGVVLDPFMGSGSTGKACMREGFRFVGIDMTPEYVAIAQARIEYELARVTAAAEAAAVPAPQRDLFEDAA